MTTDIAWDNRVARNAKVRRKVGKIANVLSGDPESVPEAVEIDDARTAKIISRGCIAGKAPDLCQSHRVSSFMIRTIRQ
jgi:hypothetical protein